MRAKADPDLRFELELKRRLPQRWYLKPHELYWVSNHFKGCW
jgi:hypothetical protein